MLATHRPNFVNGNTRENFLRSARGWLADAELAESRGELAYARDCRILANANLANASEARN